MSIQDYREFIDAKTHLSGDFGFDPVYENPNCYDFQNHLIDWSLRKGRSATFADCGLGKTLMQLVWAENVHRKTNKPVLILAPLAVSLQIVEEGDKFGIDVYRSQDGKFPPDKGIITTNYERLHNFDTDSFGGIACDESSILKNFDGAFRKSITDLMRKIKYRSLYTATPSPNDYTELGTSSEALGDLGHMDMLSTFFKSTQNEPNQKRFAVPWRFKGHSEQHFWRWVSSWARAIRKPSDMGYSDDGWILPALNEVSLVAGGDPAEGELFSMPVIGLTAERIEKNKTLQERCELAAENIMRHDTGVSWCHLNKEADLLTSLIPNAVNLQGSDKDEAKIEKFRAFKAGEIKHLVSKPKIAALGVNWQHCNACTYFDDHSYEQYYQAVRRFWRFGQKRDVTTYNITTPSLMGITNNRAVKHKKAEKMFASMMEHMLDAQGVTKENKHIKEMEQPSWL